MYTTNLKHRKQIEIAVPELALFSKQFISVIAKIYFIKDTCSKKLRN